MTHMLREFGDYVDLEPIAEGSFGIVYKGFHRELDRWDAVKILREEGADGERISAFLKEARTAAAVHLAGSPHVAGVYNCGVVDGRPFIAAELVDGQTLEAWLADLRRESHVPSIEQAVNIAVGIARGLAHAHAHRIAHHDIKPGNIILRESSLEPVIVDFGSGATLGAVAKLVGDDCLTGTPRYMAPEQALGAARPFSPESDVYSLGLVMYELLTGQPAFASHPLEATSWTGKRLDEEVAALREHYFTLPPRPRYLRADVPPSIDRLCMRCLEPEITNRAVTAHDIVAELKSWQESRTFVGRWRARWPWAACLICVVAIVAGIALKRLGHDDELGDLRSFVRFQNDPHSDSHWIRLRPSVTEIMRPDLEPPDARYEDGLAILTNRGILFSSWNSPSGISMKLRWMYVRGTGTYCDILTVGLRTTGVINPQWPHELEDGILVKFVPSSGQIIISHAGSQTRIDEYTGVAIERCTWHEVKVVDDGQRISVFFDDMDKPKISVAMPDNSTHHRLVIYNREVVGHINKESVIDDVEVRVPRRPSATSKGSQSTDPQTKVTSAL